jgi:transposase-like protein
MESEKNCILVIVGVDEYGKKEVVAIDDGFRESKESWQGLLLDLKGRGLKHAPKLAIGDGALGFWSALTEEYPDSVQQRCWVHKTSNCSGLISKMAWLTVNGNKWLKLIDFKNPFRLALIDYKIAVAQII